MQQQTKPALREWMSVDPLVKWNPSQLLNRPGNWHAVRYAANQPMEYVDPSGEWVHLVIGAAPGGASAGSAAHASGLSPTQVTQAAVIGALSGALGATGLGGLSGAFVLGAVTNAATQAVAGGDFTAKSLVVSGAASAFGFKMGNFMSQRFTIPTNALGPKSSNFGLNTSAGYDATLKNAQDLQKLFDALVGGMLGGLADAAGSKLLERTSQSKAAPQLDVNLDLNSQGEGPDHTSEPSQSNQNRDDSNN